MIKQLCVAVGLAAILWQNPTALAPTVSGYTAPPEISQNIKVEVSFKPNYHKYVETNSITELFDLMEECKKEMDNAHIMAEAARALGYEDSHPIIQLAKQEYEDAKIYYQIYLNKFTQLGWEIKRQEYPEATKVWLYLKSLGYNDYICAGILGNIMAEVGGNTLSINPSLYDNTYKYYGMCQWSLEYYPDIQDLSLEKQCDFLKGNIKEEIDTFGHLYQKDFDYEEFISLSDCREAALAFAKTYERCNAKYYNIRKNNAEIAYKYFVN